MINHAFLSNGYGSALISKDLSVDWLSLPRFDSQPLFCHLLDEDKECRSKITFPEKIEYKRSYVKNALMLKTEAYNERGRVAVVLDFMPLAESALMRVIDAKIPFELYAKPLFNYGMIEPSFYARKNGAIFKDPNGTQALELKFVWSSKVEKTSNFSWMFSPGKGYILFLYSADVGYGLFSKKGKVYSVPSEAIPASLNYWESSLEPITIDPPKWAEKVFIASLLVIMGLIYKPSGALVSSPTTSLPEKIGDVRNWDYRFAWIRDSSLAAEALIKSGHIIKGREILNFLVSVLDPSMKPFNHTLYAIDGGPPPTEFTADWLSGYKNSKPVRIGNAAHLQIQLDIEGEFMSALYTYYEYTKDKRYIQSVWWAIESIVKYISKNYEKKDSGLWEERGPPKHYTHSKVAMWNALNLASKLAEELGKTSLSDEWKRKADEIKSYVLKNSWNERVQSFTRYFGSEDVDASLLVMPIYGIIDLDDDRFKLTLERIEKELVVDHLVFRYRKDFLGEAAYPFGLASYWMSKVKLLQGQREEAEKYVKKLASCSNELGLLGEHIDPKTCEPRGNYPHVFSHTAIILGIYELSEHKKFPY